MKDIILTTPVYQDEYTAEVSRLFGLEITDTSSVTIQNKIELPNDWNIGLIYGPSGSGKSTLLGQYGEPKNFDWSDKPVISNFTNVSPERATQLLCSVGFSSVPAWIRPYHCLSVGEQFRANLARVFSEDKDVYVIDEFTSVVDRNVAKSLSNVLAKFVRKTGKKVVLASCHSDILEFLLPDWYYNPVEGVTRTGSDSLQRPKIPLDIIRCSQTAWDVFKHHHYLNTTLSKGARCFLALWEGVPVAFSAALSFPHASLGYSWRESRTVVLPDYQGLRIGVSLSDHIGAMAKATGCNYFSKTIHPAMVSYRRRARNWIELKGSGKVKNRMGDSKWLGTSRGCFSFKYVGPPSTVDEAKLFYDDSAYCQRKKKKKYAQGLIVMGQGSY